MSPIPMLFKANNPITAPMDVMNEIVAKYLILSFFGRFFLIIVPPESANLSDWQMKTRFSDLGMCLTLEKFCGKIFQ